MCNRYIVAKKQVFKFSELSPIQFHFHYRSHMFAPYFAVLHKNHLILIMIQYLRVTIVCRGTVFCDFGLRHTLHVLLFVICTQIWQRIDILLGIHLAYVCEYKLCVFGSIHRH